MEFKGNTRLKHDEHIFEVIRDAQTGHFIAETFGQNKKANAALFKAAPDLLDTLQTVLNELNKEFCMKDNKPECFDLITRIAEKAINKALKF